MYVCVPYVWSQQMLEIVVYYTPSFESSADSFVYMFHMFLLFEE